MQVEDRDRLLHVIEYGEHAAAFVRGRTRADLDTDLLLRLALTRALEIIGEAATRVSRQFKALHPDLPWAQLSGMRNRLVHAYADVDRDILWAAAVAELPLLPARIRELVEGS